jgi:hypothetical protein
MAKNDDMSFDLMIAKKQAEMKFVEDVIDDVGHAAEIVGEDLADAGEAFAEAGGGDDEGAVAVVIDGVVRSDLRPGVSLDELVRIREERTARQR